MSWWIYENWTVVRGGKARVHYTKCPYCNNGQGTHPNASHKNDKWHGSYASSDEARNQAKRLGRKLTDICTYCQKHYYSKEFKELEYKE